MRCLRTLQALQAESRAAELAAPARRQRGRPIAPARNRMAPALVAALLATTERPRGSSLDQRIDLRISG
jgi:hypothetical protein